MLKSFSDFLSSSFTRYALIGASAFLADYITLTSLFYLFSTPLMLATSAGFLVGLIVSFSMNRLWVFSKSGRHRNALRQSIEYTGLLVFNYFFTVFGVAWLNDRGVEPAFGKIFLMVFIMTWNYIIFKKIIFAKKGN